MDRQLVSTPAYLPDVKDQHPDSSKDALINVYSRSTLTLHAVLRGHEGPVNAIGLEGGRVVSASGDGRMMLWDAGSGRCERVFEGHERGLACIEFKVCPCLYPRSGWSDIHHC